MSVRDDARDDVTVTGRPSPAFVVSWFGAVVLVLVLVAGLLVAALTSAGEVGPPVDPAFEQAPTAEGATPAQPDVGGSG